jgi:hypothetical protein
LLKAFVYWFKALVQVGMHFFKTFTHLFKQVVVALKGSHHQLALMLEFFLNADYTLADVPFITHIGIGQIRGALSSFVR